MSYRIAVDTGGTFTDVVVAAPGGALTVGKAPSTPSRSADGVKAGLADAARTVGIPVEELIGDADVLIYGTTWATNAIVTGSTAKTALLVTEGFPDILVYRQGGKLHPFELHIDPLKPYVPRRLTAEIPERVTAEGEVEQALDEDAARTALTRLARQNVEAVAVCLLWSIKNPAHEERLGALIEEAMPGIPLHALASPQPDPARIPARVLSRNRRVAEASDATPFARAPRRPRRRRLRWRASGQHRLRRPDARGGRRRPADLHGQIGPGDGAARRHRLRRG